MELNHAYTLLRLILVSARELEREDKLDEALDRYFEALRVLSALATAPGLERGQGPLQTYVYIGGFFASRAMVHTTGPNA